MKTSEIHKLAGQRNESAVHYHFGDRRSLVMAIIIEMDPVGDGWIPNADTAPTSAEGVLRYIVDRLAVGLGTPEGRDRLRIVNQMMGRYTQLTELSPLGMQFITAVDSLRRFLPDASPVVVGRRAPIAMRFITDQIAERARIIDDDGGVDPVDDREFLDELVAMSLAILLAPVPGDGAGEMASAGRRTRA